MKVAIITDIHFDIRNGSQHFASRYQRFFDETFFPTLADRKIDNVWILGDTWEYRTKLNTNSLHRAREMFFDPMRDAGVKVTMIYGNHDVYWKQSNEINSVDFLEAMYPNIHVVKEHETIEFDGKPINFISWINNTNLEQSLAFIKSCPPTLLCGHFEIKSFEMHRGAYCDHGFDKSVFDRFTQVFSGHFHVRSTDGRITYLGNPFQTNWGDYGQERGFHIYDTESGELEFIRNPFDNYVKLAYTEDLDLLNFTYDDCRDKFVRIYVQSFAKTNQHKLGLFLERLNQVAYSCDVVEIDETELSIEGNIEALDNDQLITAYINDVVNNDNIDKSVLLTMFRELFAEAQNMVELE